MRETDGPSPPTRRRFLLAVGASAATTGLAGCSIRTSGDGFSVDVGGDDGGSEPTTTGTAATTEPTSTAMPTKTTTPPPEETTSSTDSPTSQRTTERTTTSAPTTTTATSTSTTRTTTATPTTTTSTPAPPQRVGGTLQLVTGSLTSLDPVAATDSGTYAVLENVFDGLTTFRNGDPVAELQLASDISVAADDRTYTVTLKADATFHDGSAVTTSDVVYSWERLAASENSRRSYLLLDHLGVEHDVVNDEYDPGSLAVRAVDDRTLEFTLAEPFAATRELLAFPALAPIPEGIVGDVDGYSGRMSRSAFAKNPVGSGPFTLDTWVQGDEVVLSRFADYHGQAPDLDGVRWEVINDATRSYQYGQNRSADFVPIPHSKYDPRKRQVTRTDDTGRRFGTYGPMANDETVSYLGVPVLTTYYVAFNMLNVPKPVRQAVASVTNQHDIVENVLDGRGSPAYHFTPPAIYPDADYDAHASGSYPYGYDSLEIDAARRVMEDAGYSASNRYSLTFTSYQSTTFRQIGALIRDLLASAHIDMNVEEVPFATLLSRGQQGSLEAFVLGWGAEWPRPDNFLARLNPPATDTDGSVDGAYLDWDAAAGRTTAARDAKQAWDRIRFNQGPSDAAQQTREAAYVTMEEANWEAAGLVPIYHPIDERFRYDGVDVAPFGGLGSSYQAYDRVVKNG